MGINKNKVEDLKPCLFIGDSIKKLRGFPDEVKQDFGTGLMFAQSGKKAASSKRMTGLGSGVVELLESHDGNTYRCVYLVRLKGFVYVLHSFQKKSKKGAETPKHEIDIIKARIKMAEADYEERMKK